MTDKKNLKIDEDIASLIKNTPTMEEVYGKQDIIDKSEDDLVPVDIWDNSYYGRHSLFEDDEELPKRKRGRPRLSEEEIQRRLELVKNKPRKKRGRKPKTVFGEDRFLSMFREDSSFKGEPTKPKKEKKRSERIDYPNGIRLKPRDALWIEKLKKYFIENAVDGKIIINHRDLMPVFGFNEYRSRSYLEVLKKIGFVTVTKKINHKINTILLIIKLLNGEDIPDRGISTSIYGIRDLIYFMESCGVIEFHPENYQKLFDRQNRLVDYIRSTNEVRKNIRSPIENQSPSVRKKIDILYDYLELQQNTTFFQKPMTMTLEQISDVLKNYSVPMLRNYLRALRDEGRIHFVYSNTNDPMSRRIIRLGPGPNSNVERIYNNIYPTEFTINPKYLEKVDDSEENAD